jgi:branched-subunit amino acid transport protein
VGTAALAALIATTVVTQVGSGDLSDLVPVVAALGAGGVVAWRQRGMFLVLITGLAADRLAFVALTVWS